jgi:cytochrome c oxidase subunit 3
MKKQFEQQYSPEVNERTKKTLVWFIVFSITMMFAGFTSGYIVSMGDNFWVKVNMPSAFYWSALVIVLSSISLIIGIRAIKKDNLSQGKLWITITFILGLSFTYLQFRGYQQLYSNGAVFSTWIIVDNGRYGDYFEIKKEGEFLSVENNQYFWKGEKLEGTPLQNLQVFMLQFLNSENGDLQGINYGQDYVLFLKGEPLTLLNGSLVTTDGTELSLLDYERLQYLAINVRDNRADFFMRGEMGVDFQLFYKGKPLDYKNRVLYYNGQELSTALQNKLLRGNKDTSTAYLYVITFLHLLHVLAGVIMLFAFVKNTFSGKYDSSNTLSLRAGGIFWHFLGALWIYLLLFLSFIH